MRMKSELCTYTERRQHGSKVKLPKQKQKQKQNKIPIVSRVQISNTILQRHRKIYIYIYNGRLYVCPKNPIPNHNITSIQLPHSGSTPLRE